MIYLDVKDQLKEGTKVTFKNKWGETQKGTFTGNIEQEGDEMWGEFICRPWGGDDETGDVICLYPLSEPFNIISEDEFKAMPWVTE
jgi:hypothetical protein